MKKLKCPVPRCTKIYRSRFILCRHVHAFHYRPKRCACQLCDKHTLCKHTSRVHANTTVTEIPMLTSLLRFCTDPELKLSCEPSETAAEG